MIPACTRNECGSDGRNCKAHEACQLPEPSDYEELTEWFADMTSAGITLLKYGAALAVVVLLLAAI